jgi:2-polyprenyl-3-methyl-5-hydroxy-6-metoxy-1,4-benzoquinol methylase
MIISWSSGSSDDNMDEAILVALRGTVSRHPWWTARAALVLALLRQQMIFPPASIIEAGCGWGTNFERLEAAGYKMTGLDISRKTLARLDRADRQLIEADLARSLPESPPL